MRFRFRALGKGLKNFSREKGDRSDLLPAVHKLLMVVGGSMMMMMRSQKNP